MTETSSGVHSALSKALQEASETLWQHAKFSTSVKDFQRQLSNDLDRSQGEVQSYLTKIMEGLEVMIQTAVDRVSTSIGTVEADITGLGEVRVYGLIVYDYSVTDKAKNLQRSNDEATTLQKNIGRVFQRVVEGSSELAAAQTDQWEHSRDLASGLHNSLESMREIEIRALVNAFGGIQGQLVDGLYEIASENGKTNSGRNIPTSLCP